MKQKEYELARQVLTLANRIVKNRNNHLKELNITAEQADSLLFFHAHHDSSISDLKEYLQISHQTARGIVKRLEEKEDCRTLETKWNAYWISVINRHDKGGTETVCYIYRKSIRQCKIIYF